ncbi:MAG: N-acetylmuramoyl-L-alanine amidase [Beijerinckiaceae bacterium]|nr:N-acetylmuramoyl-L-alanine amidase [Beijerinckiaceae bacterium]
MAGSGLFRKIADAASAVAIAAGILAHASVSLTLLPSALQYLSLRAEAGTVQPGLEERPIASSVRLEQSGDRATLSFDLSAPLEAEAFVLADPDRVIVDLPQTNFALDAEAGKPANPPQRKTKLVASYRFGQLEPGKSRIVLDLGYPAKVVRVTCEKNEGNGQARLVIELAKTDTASFRSAVQAARARLAALAQSRKPQKPERPSTKPVIMLDPGHGGIDRGASVKGLVEKELVFDFAKAVTAKLEADGRFKIVMTREADSFIPLSERVRMARDGNAALFVSIHADTMSEAAEVSGATVYTLSDRASDAEAARLAEKENQSDAAAGLDTTDDGGDVSGILFDLTRRETRAYSHMFARTLVNYWRVVGKLNKNPRRSAGFRVLRAPDVPSILLELGYLSNDTDSHALNSAQWREKAAGQVAEAIVAFFSSRESSATLTGGESDSAPVGKIPPAR